MSLRRLCMLVLGCIWMSGTCVAQDAESALLKLVRTQVRDLSFDEKLLIGRIAVGQRMEKDQQTFTVRSSIVELLCKTREALELVPTRGLYFEHISIDGDLDLSFAKLSVPLTFDNCRFVNQTSRLLFRQASFLSITMRNCFDVPGINARGLRVEHSFLFESQSLAEIDLKNADIGNDLDLEGAELQLNKSDARACIYARNARIGGDVILDLVKAYGPLDFQGVTIGGVLSIHQARFQLPWNPQASEEATVLDLVGTIVGRDIEIDDTFITGKISLTDADITKSVRIQRLVEGSMHSLDLAGMSCNRLVVDATARPPAGRLRLHGCVYDDISIVAATESEMATCLSWLRLPGRERFSEQPFEHLAGILRKQGKDDIARAILIAKVEEEPLTSYVDIIQRRLAWMIAYGYSPLRAVWLANAVILMGFVVFKGAYRRGLFVVRLTHAPAVLKSPNLTLLMYSVDVFVPLVDFGVGPLYVPGKVDVGMEAGETTLFRLYYWFHVAAGWLICTVAVAGLTGLIRV